LTAWLEPSDFPVRPGFLNGIVAADDQRVALVADQGTGAGVPGDGHLFKVDLVHRAATEVRESGGLIGASDGLLREGNRLYGVVNVPAGNGGWTYTVNLAILDPALTVATVVAQSDARTEGQTPTTIARDGRRLLWVNSQLGNPDPAPPFTVEEVLGLR
jgi:hypothetical protein